VVVVVVLLLLFLFVVSCHRYVSADTLLCCDFRVVISMNVAKGIRKMSRRNWMRWFMQLFSA